MKRLSILVLTLGTILVGIVSSPALTAAPSPTPTPTKDRLAAPPMPASPSQADLGAQVYYQVCMACHGDQGQGLTEEWRAVWGEDSNCWASKCHALDHPPQGFDFPKTCCLAVMGDNTLTRFKTAEELHTYLLETMPWWNPGYLKSEEYWQLTAFLVRAQGALPEGVEIGPGNASVFHLHLAAPLPGDNRPALVLLAGLLVVCAAFIGVQSRLR